MTQPVIQICKDHWKYLLQVITQIFQLIFNLWFLGEDFSGQPETLQHSLQGTVAKNLLVRSFHRIPLSQKPDDLAVQSQHRPSFRLGRMLGKNWFHSHFQQLRPDL